MLLDLAHWLVQPAPVAARRLGYVGESVRLASRSRRCRAAWAPHLAAAKDAVRAAIEGLDRHDTAVVLGAGLLDDVPIDTLATAFRRVVLVDAVHPWRGRWRARHHRNVERLTHDLSGTQDLLLGRGDALGPALPDICREADLVVSANLLSQLPILPVARLEAAGRLGPWTDADAFGHGIVAAHLDALAGLPARICLVTDRDETEEARDGRAIARIDLLYGVDPGPAPRAWDWVLAPFGEAARDRRLVHRVSAWPDWRPA
ncbi:hypothetical protein [Methylobacterium platani]|uniref:Class I SAM-dependent methyltransferase n=2 Tax=Methylobacterium platani TaxID=427683 RepID=A0A179S3K2_9HYPH|nr:hypothetical protein [Methylobacterium platani]KMO17326.1 hypothetical protein SQ03_12600 [Methylobacterium platani JCM 14648]OAS18322.1 hypothetical protein A5481_26540 [Methylobacterium platani]